MAAVRSRFLQVVVVGLLLACLVPAGLRTVHARQATPAAASGPSWLVVQTFEGATLRPDPATGAFTLTLSGVEATVLAFTDHPDRLVALIPTPDFAQAAAEAQPDPLNAALAAPRADGTATLMVVELVSVAHDATTATMTYQVVVLGGEERGLSDGAATPLAVPMTELAFGAGHLFVDDIDVPVHVPVNVCSETTNVIAVLNPAFGNVCVND